MKTGTVDPRARRRARRALMQALYAWQMTDASFVELRRQFAPCEITDATPRAIVGKELRGADLEYFLECLRGVIQAAAELDPLFAPHLGRTVDQLDPVERAILRAGAFELRDRLDVPAPVVINEWVEIAKGFGATESFRYVNGVLDRVARELRAAELAPAEE